MNQSLTRLVGSKIYLDLYKAFSDFDVDGVVVLPVRAPFLIAAEVLRRLRPMHCVATSGEGPITRKSRSRGDPVDEITDG